jgi:hypothetical protein
MYARSQADTAQNGQRAPVPKERSEFSHRENGEFGGGHQKSPAGGDEVTKIWRDFLM